MQTRHATWSFDWLTSWDDVLSAGFVNEWSGWMEQALTSHVFAHPALARAWIETHEPLRAIAPLCALGRCGSASAFWPLVLWRRNWKNALQRVVIPMGYSAYDYHDPLVMGDADAIQWTHFWQAAMEDLHARWGRSFDAACLTGIRDACRPPNDSPPAWRQESACPYLEIGSYTGPGDLLPSLKSSLRGDLRRQKRRLQEMGTLSLRVYADHETDEAQAALRQLLHHHVRRWPAAYHAPGFLEKLLAQGTRHGLIHFSELRAGSRAVSWHLGLLWKDRFYYYLPAMDKEFADYSPGKLHLFYCVEDAIARRLSTFDYLRGEERYKAGWASGVMPLWSTERSGRRPLAAPRNWFVRRVHPWLRHMA